MKNATNCTISLHCKQLFFGMYPAMGVALYRRGKYVRRIWSICAFDQTRCAFGQLRKSTPNPNSDPNPNTSPNLNPNRNPIVSAMCDGPNIVQFVKCCTTDKLISSTVCLSNAQLTKCALHSQQPGGLVSLSHCLTHCNAC